MESLTVWAASPDSARAMLLTLADFDAEVVPDAQMQYRVEVRLRSDREIVDVLKTLERYVNERQSGPARIGLYGHEYRMHPEPSPD